MSFNFILIRQEKSSNMKIKWYLDYNEISNNQNYKKLH